MSYRVGQRVGVPARPRWASPLGAVLAAVLGAGALAGCGRDPGAGAAGAAPPAADLRPVSVAELREVIARPGARAVLVNVWATWCLPCRKEFPDLLRAARELRPSGVRLVLVSADFDDNADAARRFLERHGVDFTSYLKAGSDMEFIDSLSPRWTGALPATFVFDGAGDLRDFWEGETGYDIFVARTRAVLDDPAVAAQGGVR